MGDSEQSSAPADPPASGAEATAAPRTYSVVAISSVEGEPDAGVRGVRYDWQEDGLSHIKVDDPNYPFLLYLDLSSEGLRELRVSAQENRTLGRVDVQAIPLRLVADLVRLGVDLNLAVQSCMEQGVSLEGTQAVPLSDDAQSVLRQVLQCLYDRQPKARGGSERDDLRRRVVTEYKQAVVDGERAPRKAVSRRLGYSSQYIGQLLVEARRLGELESTVPGRKNRFLGTHS